MATPRTSWSSCESLTFATLLCVCLLMIADMKSASAASLSGRNSAYYMVVSKGGTLTSGRGGFRPGFVEEQAMHWMGRRKRTLPHKGHLTSGDADDWQLSDDAQK